MKIIEEDNNRTVSKQSFTRILTCLKPGISDGRLKISAGIIALSVFLIREGASGSLTTNVLEEFLKGLASFGLGYGTQALGSLIVQNLILFNSAIYKDCCKKDTDEEANCFENLMQSAKRKILGTGERKTFILGSMYLKSVINSIFAALFFGINYKLDWPNPESTTQRNWYRFGSCFLGFGVSDMVLSSFIALIERFLEKKDVFQERKPLLS